MIEYRELMEDEINRELFGGFIRHQVVDQCWRRENGVWVIKADPFIDDWTEADYEFLVTCLKNTIHTGGVVYGVFCDHILKGFVSVEARIFGGEHRYMDLTSLHVSEDMRRMRMGRKLFELAKRWTAKKGGRKLYISAHSAVESQSFYKSMGCREAQVYHQHHVEAEPYDCQLECEV